MGRLDKYQSIQVLRAFAAIGVVVFHTHGLVEDAGWAARLFGAIARYGLAGVDIFFVISGFVMVLTTRATPPNLAGALSFCKARFVRIAPLYWVITLSAILLAQTIPSIFGKELLPWHTAASFLFLPARDATGLIAPVLSVGWTLNYEMWFYVTFAAALLMPRGRLLALCCLLGCMAASAWLFGSDVVKAFYGSSIVAEFVFGSVLGAVYVSGRKVTLAAGCVLLLVAAATMALAPKVNDLNRFVVFGIPAVAVVAFALALESKVKWGAILPRLGGASYSIYLTHMLALPVVLEIAKTLDSDRALPGSLIAGGVGLAVIGIGVGCYYMLERPLTNAAQRFFMALERVGAAAV